MHLPRRPNYWDSHTLIRTLGSGSFATVYAVMNSAGEAFALKQFNDPLSPIVAREIRVLQALSESGLDKRCGLIALRGIYAIPSPNSIGSSSSLVTNALLPSRLVPNALLPSIEMEWAHGKDLFEVMSENGPLDTEITKQILTDVLEQLACLHEADIVHRDIKSENIIAQQRQGRAHSARLIDYGFACSSNIDLVERCASLSAAGTREYISPEIVENARLGRSLEQTKAGDMWALGIVALEMRYMAELQVLRTLAQYKEFVRRAKENSHHDALDKFIFSLLKLDPTKRPTALQAFKALHNVPNIRSPQKANASAKRVKAKSFP